MTLRSLRALPTFAAALFLLVFSGDFTSSQASSIGLDFGSGANGSADPDPSPMTASDVAGVVPQANWNDLVGLSQATPQALLNDQGLATGATVTWLCNNLWDTSANGGTDAAGNARLMMGYLDSSDTSITNVLVSNLPAAFTLSGYNVIVYYDGENGAAQRVGQYTIGSTVLYGRDAGVAFSGTFTQGQTATAPVGAIDNNAAGANAIPGGNYLVFTGLNASTFTLTAQSSVSSDATNRAPINAVQIVQVPEPAAAALFLCAVGALGARRRRTS
jgi:hypothetical protein